MLASRMPVAKTMKVDKGGMMKNLHKHMLNNDDGQRRHDEEHAKTCSMQAFMLADKTRTDEMEWSRMTNYGSKRGSV